MRIKWIYELPSKIKIPVIRKIVYKINKAIVNFFYPVFVKNENGIDATSNVIVSLTSFPARIKYVWITIETLLHQTVKPEKIILWLAEEQFPNKDLDLPKRLLCLKKYGLQIQYCDNLYPHKKYYYTVCNNPDKTIITVDDDIFYPENLIEDLMKLNQRYPSCICCTWAHIITKDNNKIKPYSEWQHGVTGITEPTFSLIPIGCGGVLYPPNTLSASVLNKSNIKECCLMADDLWLKSMGILRGTKSVRWEKNTDIFFSNMKTGKDGLYKMNVKHGKNDEAFFRIMEKYPEVQRIIIEENPNDDFTTTEQADKIHVY